MISRGLRSAALIACVTTVVGVAAAGPPRGSSRQQPPVLRGGVDLVTIDVQVTAAKDASLREFAAADFEVSISGRRRPVVSVTRLHLDEGAIIRGPARTAAPETCVFGFHRKVDKTTAHYVVAVERTGSDQAEVKQVRLTMLDKAFVIRGFVWRSPIR